MDAFALNAQSADVIRGYNQFGLSLLGALSIAVDNPMPTAPSVRTRLVNSSYELLEQTANAHVHSEIKARTDQVMEAAIKDIRLALNVKTAEVFTGLIREDLDSFISGEIDATVNSLIDQMSRDRRSVLRYQREFALEVQILISSKKQTERSAQIATKIKKQTPDYVYMDRSGKAWKSERFVKMLLRAHFFKIYNETYLYALMTLGQNKATVHKTDPDHKHNGLVFSIREPIKGLPSYGEIRKDVFHPNSHAIVVAK